MFWQKKALHNATTSCTVCTSLKWSSLALPMSVSLSVHSSARLWFNNGHLSCIWSDQLLLHSLQFGQINFWAQYLIMWLLMMQTFHQCVLSVAGVRQNTSLGFIVLCKPVFPYPSLSALLCSLDWSLPQQWTPLLDPWLDLVGPCVLIIDTCMIVHTYVAMWLHCSAPITRYCRAVHAY